MNTEFSCWTLHFKQNMHMVHLNKNIFHNISVVDVQHSVKSLFSDSTRKWAVKWVWINEGGLPSYFQQRWPLAPASLTAVWTPKTFQTNFPFPDTLLPSKDAQSGKDSQYPCPGNIERHWCDKLLWHGVIIIRNIWISLGSRRLERFKFKSYSLLLKWGNLEKISDLNSIIT